MTRVKVTEIPGAYSFEGVSYGPFEADKKTPFVEVPEALASALNLPLHEDEVKAREAEQEGEQQELGRWNVPALVEQVATLKQELNKAEGALRNTAQLLGEEHLAAGEDMSALISALPGILGDVLADRNAAQFNAKRLQDIVNVGKPENERLMKERAGLEIRVADLTRELATAQARIAELKSQQHVAPSDTPETPAEPPQQEGTPLVDGLQHADLLTAAGITSMEALEAGLIVPEGGKQSAVEAVGGIGKKTVEAYTKAVADWRKGQAAQ